MPTLVDTLAIELKLDSRELEKGLASVVEKTRSKKDDFTQQSKAMVASFEAMGASLLRVLGPIATALIGIGSAIEAIDFSKHEAAVVTNFARIRESMGMTREAFYSWKQAAETFGQGASNAVIQSFKQQQQTMISMLPGGTGLKDENFLAGLQHYGMTDISKYLDKEGNVDMDRFNRDLAAASEKIDKNEAQRTQWLQKLYITDPAQLAMYRSRKDLDKALREQLPNIPTEAMEKAQEKLQADWAKLATAAINLGNQIIAHLVDPLHEGLTDLQHLLTYLKGWEPPDWLRKGVESGWLPPWWDLRATPPSGKPGVSGGGKDTWEPPDWMKPYVEWWQEKSTPKVIEPGKSIETNPELPTPSILPKFFTDWWKDQSTPKVIEPGKSIETNPELWNAPPPASKAPTSTPYVGSAVQTIPFSLITPPPVSTIPPPSTFAPSAPPQTSVPSFGATQPSQGARPSVFMPLPSPSAAPPTTPPAPSYYGPGEMPRTSVPSTAPSQEGSSQAPLGPQSSLDSSLFEMPQTASMLNQSNVAAAVPRSTINTNSNVTIGAMAFHATTNDAMLDYAPSGSERTLATGSYAVEANTSLV